MASIAGAIPAVLSLAKFIGYPSLFGTILGSAVEAMSLRRRDTRCFVLLRHGAAAGN
jgi:hypothetical protein